MRTLVTGHEGYLGSVMGPFLVEAGHEVVGIDAGLFRGALFGTNGDSPRGIHPRRNGPGRDVRDVRVEDLLGFDAVIHLAALSNDPLGDLDPELTREINRDGALRVARLAREAGVSRFLFASSCSLYGVAGDDLVNESTPRSPITPYGRSKVEVEDALTAMADDEFSPTCLRNATAYGASPALRLDVVVNNLVASGFTTGEVELRSDGTSWRPLVHAEDIARAFLAVLEAPREVVHARAFNVGRQGENYQVRDLAQMVAEALPGTRVTMQDDAVSDPRSYRVDFSRLMDSLPSYRPAWTVEEGIRELVEAFRRYRLDSDDVRTGRYVRLREIRRLLEGGRLSPDLRWHNEGKETVDAHPHEGARS